MPPNIHVWTAPAACGWSVDKRGIGKKRAHSSKYRNKWIMSKWICLALVHSSIHRCALECKTAEIAAILGEQHLGANWCVHSKTLWCLSSCLVINWVKALPAFLTNMCLTYWCIPNPLCHCPKGFMKGYKQSITDEYTANASVGVAYTALTPT